MDTSTPIGEIVESSTTTFVAQCLEVPRTDLPRLFDPPAFGSFVKIAKHTLSPLSGGEGQGERSTAETPTLLTLDVDEPDPFASPVGTRPLLGARPTPEETFSLPAAVYALVVGSTTSSIEPNRRPSALGYEDEDEIRRRQPQIFELLRTDFTGLLVAYSDGGDKGLRRHLPPVPPRIHARVWPCTVDEVRALTADLSFLRSVLAPTGGALGSVPGDELAAACLRQAREAQRDDYQFMVRAGRSLAGILADDYERLQAILRNVI